MKTAGIHGIHGIHHITAIAGDPQRNLDFYTGVLGMRLVKQTVNFDDPGTYHLYYGDELGRPGTILTFFPFKGARLGRRGTGQATSFSFSVPHDALGYWTERLGAHGVSVEGPVSRFDETVLTFYDPDDLQVELVAHDGAAARSAWAGGPIPAAYAIRGFHGITLCIEGFDHTARLLTELMGFAELGADEDRIRFVVGQGAVLDIRCLPAQMPGLVAAGSIHHVAWRTTDDASQAAWRRALLEAGYNVTPVKDRQYFHSIYYREPGGVLFEIATDSPGFTVDETPDRLGTALKLPPWLEVMRPALQERLPGLSIS